MTELVFILDRSGSMANDVEDTVGGFNAMLSRLRQEQEPARVTVVLFNQRPMLLYDRVPLEEVRPMTREDFRPMGRTALLDALGTSIRNISSLHLVTPEEYRPEKTVFTIFTDGRENASRLYTFSRISRMVREQQEEHGWEFLFMGADFADVENEARRISIARERTMSFSKADHGMHVMYCVAADEVNRARRDKGRDRS